MTAAWPITASRGSAVKAKTVASVRLCESRLTSGPPVSLSNNTTATHVWGRFARSRNTVVATTATIASVVAAHTIRLFIEKRGLVSPSSGSVRTSVSTVPVTGNPFRDGFDVDRVIGLVPDGGVTTSPERSSSVVSPEGARSEQRHGVDR